MVELREALAIGRRVHEPSDPHQARQVYRKLFLPILTTPMRSFAWVRPA